MKKNKVPEIRFPEFMDEWELRKLSELATMNARIGWQNLRTSEFLDSGDYMLITGTDFKDGKIDYSNIHYVEKERFDQDKKIKIKNDSILITKDGTLGKVAFVEGLTMPATLNAGVFNVRVKESDVVDSQYLFHYLKAPFLLKYADAQSTGGTIKHLNQNVLVNFPIPLPIIEEQKKIGTFLKQLDDTITLHQRELEILKNTKKAFLQKMFPKEGEKVPEIRFPGFTDDWEQRKLGDESEILAGGDVNKIKLKKSGKYPVLANALTNNGIMGYYDDDYRVEAPAVTVTGRGDVGHAKAQKTNFTPVVRLLSVKSKHDVDFLENAINNHCIFVESTGVPQLTSPQLGNYQIFFPTLEEQKKIGSLFKQLDDTISLHQRELTTLQNTKKAFLQKMFV